MPEARERAQRLLGRLEELIAIGHVLAAAAREVDVMLRLVPGALQLGLEVRARGMTTIVSGGKSAAIETRSTLVAVLATLSVDRKDQREVGLARASAA